MPWIADDMLADLYAERDRLTAENERLEGWGENTMDGCLRILVKAQKAIAATLEAVGSGGGASALLDELDEAVRQLSAGRKA